MQWGSREREGVREGDQDACRPALRRCIVRGRPALRHRVVRGDYAVGRRCRAVEPSGPQRSAGRRGPGGSRIAAGRGPGTHRASARAGVPGPRRWVRWSPRFTPGLPAGPSESPAEARGQVPGCPGYSPDSDQAAWPAGGSPTGAGAGAVTANKEKTEREARAVPAGPGPPRPPRLEAGAVSADGPPRPARDPGRLKSRSELSAGGVRLFAGTGPALPSQARGRARSAALCLCRAAGPRAARHRLRWRVRPAPRSCSAAGRRPSTVGLFAPREARLAAPPPPSAGWCQ